MAYINLLNSYCSPDPNPQTLIEIPFDHFSLFDTFRAMDDIQFRETLDDFYASVPTHWMTDVGPSASESYDHPGLSMSMELSGELTVPETTSHESCNNSLNLYPNYLQYLDSPIPDPYIVSQDYSISPISYHDLSHVGDFNSSLHNTDWETNVHLHSNSQNQLHRYHVMETGMSNHDIPASDVMQHSQKLDTLSTSGYTYTGFHPETSENHYQYTQLAQDNQGYICANPSSHLETTTAVASCPSSDTSPYELPNHDSFRCSSCPATPESPEPSLSPSSSIINTSSSSSPVTPHSSPPSSLPSPAAPIYSTLSQSQPPKKKRARTSKKISPPSSALTPPKARGPRKFPGGRAPIRSQHWLNTYFPNKGPCSLCGKGPTNYRADRALEHLASSHIFQAVKNLEIFDAERLQEEIPFHFIQTEEQFKFARQYVDCFKCSLCPRETSLVVREENIKKHLDVIHIDDPLEARNGELERVKGLTQKRKDWYSFHDEFLFKFSSLVQSQ